MSPGRDLCEFLDANFEEVGFYETFAACSLREAQRRFNGLERSFRAEYGPKAAQRVRKMSGKVLILKAQGRLSPEAWFTEEAIRRGATLRPGFLDDPAMCELQR